MQNLCKKLCDSLFVFQMTIIQYSNSLLNNPNTQCTKAPNLNLINRRKAMGIF